MRTTRTVFTALLLASSALASDLRSPFAVVARDAALGALEVAVDPLTVTALSEPAALTLRGVQLPGGVALDLALERVDLARCKFDYFVDGARATRLLDALDLSVWMGHVAGDPTSEVALSFSQTQCMGWVRSGGKLLHLIQDGARLVWLDDARYAAAGVDTSLHCATDSLAPTVPSADLTSPMASGGSPQLRTTTLYECKLAIETDYQLNQRFGGSVSNEAAYLTTLLAWVSYRYEFQIGTVLTFPYVQIYTTAADPWTSQDTGGNAADLLTEFSSAWAGNLPNGADLASFLSGVALGGGVAFRPGLCTTNHTFSVCSNIDGLTPFPIAQQAGNHDFHIIAHEVGHNFGAPHTHAYCPPVDQCAPPQSFGPCQTAQVCSTQGTTMSYCGQCPGGAANLTTFFHARSVTDMRTRVETTCLPLYGADPLVYCVGKLNSQGCTPAIDYVGHPTLSGLDDFHIRCAQGLNQQNGILFWGLASASAPFQGGTRCVAMPLVRTPLRSAGGSATGSDCTGSYDFFFSHVYATSAGLAAGDTVYAQYWMRDPSSASATGLSNALSFALLQ